MDLFPETGLQERKGIDQTLRANVFGRQFLVFLGKIVEDLDSFHPTRRLSTSTRSRRAQRLALKIETPVIGVGHRRVLSTWR